MLTLNSWSYEHLKKNNNKTTEKQNCSLCFSWSVFCEVENFACLMSGVSFRTECCFQASKRCNINAYIYILRGPSCLPSFAQLIKIQTSVRKKKKLLFLTLDNTVKTCKFPSHVLSAWQHTSGYGTMILNRIKR